MRDQTNRGSGQGSLNIPEPASELHTYSIPELSKFKKRELVADTEYLDGEPCPTQR